ncbi:hypothetical protein RvY_11007-1 [Ramazzottius varieornatus]|uniref:Uncharacterized protein n=1 Tax=Ramazzottius varieornatus TaxID=947166 RepID=A0A1D1VJ36_RAMVA|nr:hypothetical protein RvY_11007-1 [Ramazzottius varieornatus]
MPISAQSKFFSAFETAQSSVPCEETYRLIVPRFSLSPSQSTKWISESSRKSKHPRNPKRRRPMTTKKKRKNPTCST